MRIKQTTKQNTHNSLTYYTIFSEEGNLVFLEYLYTKFMLQVTDIINQYNAGNFEYVVQRFTNQYYNILISILSTTKYDNNPLIRRVRNFCISLVNMFNRVILQYLECKNIEKQLEQARNKASILDDPERLEEYIVGSTKRVNVFRDHMVTVPMATLKPQYSEYIKLYGFPKNANFDPTLMKGIITRLLQDGVLTKEEIYGSSSL